ncbi:hypothetical protein FIV42_13805 [Persicimonas caeni]|uniref:VOC domain-containing protein n=1 Tax=Persicimonas caeni TaxID=2292766 RepID=A0A4Y6PTX4_PERCE|nr:VOC family protein [Persicimonas caeni]QDG51781.1 hypothetical protein FIV42_13805 [Persicimonas caeni]QED33002.1 hypothetical protein FRD00_13800 [Persicimonas caeni]
MKLGPLSEIILYVEDMESQVAFYRDVLGLAVTYPAECDSYADQHWVTFDTGACSLALHGGGSQSQGKDAPKFVFDVDDIAEARQELLDHGVRVGEVRSPAPGVDVVDARDPEGNAFSIESR